MGVVFAGALAGGCYAGVGYAEDDYGEAPPPAYVESVTPYYYEGHPTYWYNNHWHYRERGHWRRYRSEPVELRRWRAQGPPPGRPLPPPGPERPYDRR